MKFAPTKRTLGKGDRQIAVVWLTQFTLCTHSIVLFLLEFYLALGDDGCFFVAPQKKSTKPLKVRSVCANNERFSHKNSNDEHKHWTYEWHTSSCAFDYFSTFVRLFVVLSLFGPFFVVDFVVAVVVCDIHSVRNSGCRRRLSYRSFRAFDSE